MPTWTPKLAVGVAEIDAQHKELFARANALLAAMSTGKPADEVKRLLAFVEDYCARHFASEERVMREKRYPGLAAHKAQHEDFTRRFQELVAQLQLKGASPTVTLATQSFVCGWLVEHIGKVDMELGKFLAGQTVSMTI